MKQTPPDTISDRASSDASTSDKRTLWDKIKGIRLGMLTHRRPGGLLHSHPLVTQNKSFDEADEDATLYFFISERSEIASSLREDDMVNITYTDPEGGSYVSVSGLARLSRDPTKVSQLWSPSAETWFAGGPSDPDLTLLEVEILDADYWDGKRSKKNHLFQSMKSMLTGRKTPSSQYHHVTVR
jgi:general stress protein 26